MYVLFLIEIYELLKEFFQGFFLMVWLGLIMYENILKCDKCATEYIEIQKSFSLWCIIVHFLRQTKAKGWLFETKFHFHSAQTILFTVHADATGHAMSLLTLAHKSNFAGHVIVTTGLRRKHFLRPGIFLRWNSNPQRVDFSQGFACNNLLTLVVVAVNDGFLHLHVRSVTSFCTSQFTFLPFGNSSIIIIFFLRYRR